MVLQHKLTKVVSSSPLKGHSLSFLLIKRGEAHVTTVELDECKSNGYSAPFRLNKNVKSAIYL